MAGSAIKARVAQLVEQRTENPRVGGSNPPPGTIYFKLKRKLTFGHGLCRVLSMVRVYRQGSCLVTRNQGA